MSRTTSTRRARALALGGLAAVAMLAGTGGVADAQTQATCSRRNPSACFQFFNPTRPAPTPTPTPTTAPAPAPAPAPLPPAPAPTANPVQVPEAARRLLDLVNGERAKAGLGQLASRDDIVSIALEHSYRMAAAGNIFHNDGYFTESVKNRIGSLVRGENVAQNTSVDDAHRRLMISPGHRANILDGRFNTVGFAVVRTANGQYWITQNFAQTRGAAPAAPRPAAATAAPSTARPTTPRAVPTTAPAPPPAPPVPAAIDVTTAVLAMVEPPRPAATSFASAAPTAAPGAGQGGMGTSIGVLVVVLVAAAGFGSWRLRRVAAELFA